MFSQADLETLKADVTVAKKDFDVAVTKYEKVDEAFLLNDNIINAQRFQSAIASKTNIKIHLNTNTYLTFHRRGDQAPISRICIKRLFLFDVFLTRTNFDFCRVRSRKRRGSLFALATLTLRLYPSLTSSSTAFSSSAPSLLIPLLTDVFADTFIC